VTRTTTWARRRPGNVPSPATAALHGRGSDRGRGRLRVRGDEDRRLRRAQRIRTTDGGVSTPDYGAPPLQGLRTVLFSEPLRGRRGQASAASRITGRHEIADEPLPAFAFTGEFTFGARSPRSFAARLLSRSGRKPGGSHRRRASMRSSPDRKRQCRSPAHVNPSTVGGPTTAEWGGHARDSTTAATPPGNVGDAGTPPSSTTTGLGWAKHQNGARSSRTGVHVREHRAA